MQTNCIMGTQCFSFTGKVKILHNLKQNVHRLWQITAAERTVLKLSPRFKGDFNTEGQEHLDRLSITNEKIIKTMVDINSNSETSYPPS